MKYELEILPKCLEEIRKLSRKNPVLESALKKKIDQILENPLHFKPLRYDLAGERRVHIMKSFVLKYGIEGNTVRIIFFGHHDDAYKR